jgi:hypothetical protein
MPKRTILSTIAVTAALLAGLAAPAVASGPPHGTYDCQELSYWFKLKGDDKYTVQTGGGGKWDWKSHRVIFKNGPMDYAYGKLRHDAVDGNPIIDIYDVQDDTFYSNCTRR